VFPCVPKSVERLRWEWWDRIMAGEVGETSLCGWSPRVAKVCRRGTGDRSMDLSKVASFVPAQGTPGVTRTPWPRNRRGTTCRRRVEYPGHRVTNMC